jgi:hypothetical protein
MTLNTNKAIAVIAVISIAALVLSGVALMYTVFARKAPVASGVLPGKGLTAYDMSTPERALRADVEMKANVDSLAKMEVERAWQLPGRERGLRLLESLRTEPALPYDGPGGRQKALVLFQVQDDRGMTRRGIQAFEKVGDRWLPTAAPELEKPVDARQADVALAATGWILPTVSTRPVTTTTTSTRP